MKNILKEFEKFCKNTKVDYSIVNSIKPYNDSTYFCPAGMQQFSRYFEIKWMRGTCANNQSCLRVNDIKEMGDGSHLAYFNMLGLFSFREMTMKQAMDWWVSFIEKYLELKIDYVTVHPKMLREWLPFIDEYIEVRTDIDCTWTDGNTFGYCMEFYINGVEVGNIVNTGGDCIDAGFGLERLDTACNGTVFGKEKVIKDSIDRIIEMGVEPSNSHAGYILRKLLNIAAKESIHIEHKFYEDEKERIKKMQEFYSTNKDKFKNKSKEWWKETHGVDIDLIPSKS